MKQTLLELTQNILSAMEDDEVNSIGDSVSALGVAQVVKDVFDEMITQLDIPGSDSLMVLESLSDVNRPNYVRFPDNLKKIHWIKYNNKDVTYITPSEFVDKVIKRDTGVDVTDFGGVTFKIATDADPKFWTSFDDEYIVVDSFNLDTESTLLSNKTMAWVQSIPQLVIADDSIPDIPEHLFPTLLATAKGRCFVNFKSVSNASEDRAARNGLVRWQNDQYRDKSRPPFNRTPNYGKPRR